MFGSESEVKRMNMLPDVAFGFVVSVVAGFIVPLGKLIVPVSKLRSLPDADVPS